MLAEVKIKQAPRVPVATRFVSTSNEIQRKIAVVLLRIDARTTVRMIVIAIIVIN